MLKRSERIGRAAQVHRPCLRNPPNLHASCAQKSMDARPSEPAAFPNSSRVRRNGSKAIRIIARDIKQANGAVPGDRDFLPTIRHRERSVWVNIVHDGDILAFYQGISFTMAFFWPHDGEFLANQCELLAQTAFMISECLLLARSAQFPHDKPLRCLCQVHRGLST